MDNINFTFFLLGVLKHNNFVVSSKGLLKISVKFIYNDKTKLIDLSEKKVRFYS